MRNPYFYSVPEQWVEQPSLKHPAYASLACIRDVKGIEFPIPQQATHCLLNLRAQHARHTHSKPGLIDKLVHVSGEVIRYAAFSQTLMLSHGPGHLVVEWNQQVLFGLWSIRSLVRCTRISIELLRSIFRAPWGSADWSLLGCLTFSTHLFLEMRIITIRYSRFCYCSSTSIIDYITK